MSDRGVPERRLMTTTRRRGSCRVEPRLTAPVLPDPPVDALKACVADDGRTGQLWLVGGEPTLRSDLPELVAALATEEVGLRTDGLPLANPSAVAPLRSAGLTRVRVVLHTARPDAHDWLVGQPGAARLAMRALRTCSAQGLAVEIEATVTRPTMLHLAELCELGAHVGARTVHLRRLTAADTSAADYRGLAPRHGLLEPCLEDAARMASRRGLRLRLHGFPSCAARLLEGNRVAPDHVKWLVAPLPPWQELAHGLVPAASSGRCIECPAAAYCAGAPADYVAAFGWGEFSAEPAPEPASSAGHERLRIAFAGPCQVACRSCASGSTTETPEPSRNVRLRMIRAASRGAAVLRIASTASLSHPAAPALLRELRFLRFEQVELVSEGSVLSRMSDEELSALRNLSRLDVPLYGPDAQRHDAHVGVAGAFEATLQGLARVADGGFTAVGAFAVLHDAAWLTDYVAAWQDGLLPGAPAFRLSEAGGSLERLAAKARELPASDARTAIAALLPPCLFVHPDLGQRLSGPGPAFDFRPDETVPPSGSDRLGRFRPCRCDRPESANCPGLAVGWKTAIEPA